MEVARRKIFESLESSNILITGATGFVGTSILREGIYLNDHFGANLHFWLVTRKKTANIMNLVEGRKDVSLVISTIGEDLRIPVEIDVAFHCATPASAQFNMDSPVQMLELNIEGMKWILQPLLLQKKVAKLIFTSSGAVYGPQPQGLSHIPEGYLGGPDTTNRNSGYAEGKRVAEFLLAQAGYRQQVVPIIARLFAFSGQGLPLDRHFALGNFVADSIYGNKITIRGTGRDLRSYLDSVDMAIWLWSAAAQSNLALPIHIGSEKEISIFELANLVASNARKLLNKTIEIEVLGVATPFDGHNRYVPQTSQTRAILGVQEWTTLESSIGLMLNRAL